MSKKFSPLIILIVILSGCYTVLKHPDVQYADMLGIHPDSIALLAGSQYLGVKYNDNCASCHRDYSWGNYHSPNGPAIDDSTDKAIKIVQFQYLPWWSSEVWTMEESDFNAQENTSRRSRRSYKKASTGGGGSPEYMSPPGISPPANLKVKSSSSSTAKESGNTNTAVREKDSPEGIKSDNTNQKNNSTKKKKPKRRR